LVCDLCFAFGSGVLEWKIVALYTMGGGIVGALLAAVPGLIDLISLPAEPRKTALVHMAVNLTIVVLYAVNFGLRLQTPTAPGLAWLSVLTIAMLLVSGWLGGKLVYVSGVAVSAGEGAPRRRESTHAPAAGE
jgi:uncharacterized membrane protein